jgi:hypothetical protein
MTRERKIEFIKSDGTALMNAVTDMFAQRGEAWLTDRQIDDLYCAAARDWELRQRMNAANREVASARRAGDAA